MLDWNRLLSEKRLRGDNNSSESRNAFEADYDRIVGSSSVRRLEDKAQVFPLQKDDVVRTRLTHSIEVSAVARSLGKHVGKKLEKEGIFDREMTEKLQAVLQTVGLIHDLGNPPFGHYGEDIIRDWFKKIENRNEKLDSQQIKDFEYFDGNVQNLRIVTKLQTMNDVNGANFTFATLATLIKYPVSSEKSCYKNNKFGFFKSEENIVKQIWDETGLSLGVRHPATYLLEAADDIIYLCDDIEDGVKKGVIDWEKEYSIIKAQFEQRGGAYSALIEYMKKNTPNSELSDYEKSLARVRLFRNKMQGILINVAVDEFMKSYNEIMSGTYKKKDLLSADSESVECLQKITKKYCFSCREVLRLELVGKRVLTDLLNIFYEELVRNTSADTDIENDIRSYSGKLFHLISGNYIFIAKYDYESEQFRKFEEISDYEKIHLIVDYISGMTDSYAVKLYKELTGISLPE